MFCIAMGGSPASGKTTVMRHVISKLGKGKLKKVQTLVYQLHQDSKTLVLGDYSKPGFGGTDRLSMAVQPVALGVVQSWASDPAMEKWNILFEGDRLFNNSFLSSLSSVSNLICKNIMLEVSEETQKQRHVERNDTQNETWIKGRQTKAKKLMESLPNLTVLKNENVKDLDSNVEHILNLLRNTN